MSDQQLEKEWQLEAEMELRIETGENRSVKLKLVDGTAEVFGTELALNREYEFHNAMFAVFTWYGCRIIVTGRCEADYTSGDTPMVSYVNTHAQLEARRDAAVAQKKRGPVVMLAGPTDSGKTSLSKILLAYAVRQGRTPVFVDLDVGQGSLGIPGCVGAVAYDTTTLAVEDTATHNSPVTYYYGHASAGHNPKLLTLLTERLADTVRQRQDNDEEARSAGVIINTCGWVEGQGYEILLQTAKLFEVDVVLVLGQDRLLANLTRDLAPSPSPSSPSPSGVVVVKLPRSGGVVERNKGIRQGSRTSRIREYFYGGWGGVGGTGRGGGGAASTSAAAAAAAGGVPRGLNPVYITLRVGGGGDGGGEVQLFRVGGVQVGASCLPVGIESKLDPTDVHSVDASAELSHSLLAVCHPPEDLQSEAAFTPKDILRSNVAGFVYVRGVDVEKGTIEVLAPCPGSLPSPFLLVGDVKWMDH